MSDQKLTDLGLAEFVAGLISETFEAVSSSMEDQIRRQNDLETAADMNLADFSRAYITDEQVTEALTQLFGINTSEAILSEGSTYLPPSNKRNETPPFQEVLELELIENEHYKKSGRKYLLLQKGIDLIYDRVRAQLAEEQQNTLRSMLNSGLPRIVVDKGKILSKVTFKITENESEEEEAPQGTPSTRTNLTPVRVASALPAREALATSRLKKLNRIGTTRSNLLLPGVQFKVKQADSTTSTESTTNIYGEVEIEFRTVS